MSELSAFAQDPERRHSNETRSVNGYCQVGLGARQYTLVEQE